jgi:large subunit ribosomal protein L4
MPKKIRLLAMKTLLSAKLSEGRLIIVDNDDLPERRTKHVAEMLSNFSETERYLYVTGHFNEDFKVASKNIDRLTYTTFDDLRIIDILKNDKIMMNLDGVLNLMRYLHEQTVLLHKPRAIKFEGELTTELQRAKDLKSGKLPTDKVKSSNAASL